MTPVELETLSTIPMAELSGGVAIEPSSLVAKLLILIALYPEPFVISNG